MDGGDTIAESLIARVLNTCVLLACASVRMHVARATSAIAGIISAKNECSHRCLRAVAPRMLQRMGAGTDACERWRGRMGAGMDVAEAGCGWPGLAGAAWGWLGLAAAGWGWLCLAGADWDWPKAPPPCTPNGGRFWCRFWRGFFYKANPEEKKIRTEICHKIRAKICTKICTISFQNLPVVPRELGEGRGTPNQVGHLQGALWGFFDGHKKK